jgi:ketosteroid isomerase-like protein
MSADAAALIRGMFAAIDAGEFERLREYFSADVVYERPGYEPLRGIDALEYFYRHERIIARGAHDLQGVLAGPRAAACWGRFRGLSRRGDALDERFADVYELRDGRVARRTTHFFRPAI